MKRFILFTFSLLLTFTVAIAQDGINYQGAATDANGDELTNQNISIRASVLSGSASGNLEWEETHSATTDQFGLFNVVIGQGTNTTNGATANFDDMDWGSGNHFLKIEMDATGGTNYAMIGTTQMMSVPYALYAKSAGIDSAMLANMIGSSGGGVSNCNLYYPDGLANTELVSEYISYAQGDSYTVPIGKNLYVGAHNGLYINGTEFADGGNNHVIVGSGDVITANVNFSPLHLDGFLVDANVDPMYLYTLGSSFTIPSNKKFVLLYSEQGFINGKQILGTANNSPIIVDAGDVISNAINYNFLMSGYLVDENYFADCGGGGGSSSSATAVDSAMVAGMIASSGGGGSFGDWELIYEDLVLPGNMNTVNIKWGQASKDGFLYLMDKNGSLGTIYTWTDENILDTIPGDGTLMSKKHDFRRANTGYYETKLIPIQENSYWVMQIPGGHALDLYFIPLESGGGSSSSASAVDSAMVAGMIANAGGGGTGDWELLYDCLNCGQTLPWGTVDRFGVAESDGFLYVIAHDITVFTGDDFDSTTTAWSGDYNNHLLQNNYPALIPLKKDMSWHIQFHSAGGEVRKAYFVPNSGGGSSTVSSSGNGSGCDFKYPDGLDGEVVNLDLANDYTVPSGKTLYINHVFLYGEWLKMDGERIIMGYSNSSNIASGHHPPSNGLNSPLIVGSGSVLSVENGAPTGQQIQGILMDEGVQVMNLDLANDYTVPSGKTLYLTNIFLYGEYLYVDGERMFMGYSNASNITNGHYPPSNGLNSPLIVGSGSVLSVENGYTTDQQVNGYLVDENYFAGCGGGGGGSSSSSAGLDSAMVAGMIAAALPTPAAQIGEFRDGGVVFWVDASGQHGLVCDIQDLGTAEWGCTGTTGVCCYGTGIGIGQQNTIDILNECSTAGIAADLCANSTAQGYSDWFLPSKDALYELYTKAYDINFTLVMNGGSGFSNDNYWSSSKVDHNTAIHIDFSNGFYAISGRGVTYNVRAVRAF